MTAAAFTASYSDFKLIKTRGVVSISFEVPVEQAQAALDVLGGMPVAATEVWCGIARLVSAGETGGAQTVGLVAGVPRCEAPVSVTSGPGQPAPSTARETEREPAGAAASELSQRVESPHKAKTAFRDMRPANQAGILCDTPAFRKFIGEKQNTDVKDGEHAAELVRWYCGVKSRSDIRPRTPSGDRWAKLVDEYRTWMHQPEYADA